jgi:hypothetical protein
MSEKIQMIFVTARGSSDVSDGSGVIGHGHPWADCEVRYYHEGSSRTWEDTPTGHPTEVALREEGKIRSLPRLSGLHLSIHRRHAVTLEVQPNVFWFGGPE